jgi:hypothetical protein
MHNFVAPEVEEMHDIVIGLYVLPINMDIEIAFNVNQSKWHSNTRYGISPAAFLVFLIIAPAASPILGRLNRNHDLYTMLFSVCLPSSTGILHVL